MKLEVKQWKYELMWCFQCLAVSLCAVAVGKLVGAFRNCRVCMNA